MINFALTEEQLAIQGLAREFAQREIAPVALHYDRTAEFPWPVARKAFDVGLMNLTIPTEFGGQGLGYFDNCLVWEELAAGCAGINVALGINSLGCGPVLAAGSDEQKREWLPAVTRECTIVSYCMTEPEAGSDVAGIQTTAVKHGNDYVLNGTKRFISGGTVARWFSVFAVTDKGAGHKALSCFWVPRDTPGVSVPRHEDTMGQRAANTAEVVFQDVRVPEYNRIGREGDGFAIAMAVFNGSRPGVAAASVGLARAAMEHAFDYAQQRRVQGQAIAQYQAIQFKLADMAMEIAAARQLVWHAAWLLDHGQRAAREASYAKAFAADMCMRHTTEAVQIFGGYGYSREYPVEKYMRDAKVMQIYEGTSEIQRLIIFREMMRQGVQALRP